MKSDNLNRKWCMYDFTILEINIHHLSGFLIFFSNATDAEKIVYKGNESDSRSYYDIQFENLLTRRIKIQRLGILTLCEVEVTEGGKVKMRTSLFSKDDDNIPDI